MAWVAKTPNRVDLAGGTLDIYPLYLFLEEAVTVNIAVQIYSRAEIQPRSDSEIHFHSLDLDKKFSCASLEECIPQGDLDLLIRAVRHYAPACGIQVTTHNEAPRGSGIGASSALLMAVSGALNQLNSNRVSEKEMVDAAAALEAQVIRIPTGKQDYLAAVHGGVNACWFRASGASAEAIPYQEKEIAELESRIILSYTGIPHFSGENNWTIVKRYIDGESNTVGAMKRIKQTALKMREAVQTRDWVLVGKTLREEWENRKALAPGVTTPEVEHFMAHAREAGAEAGKLCGAGGGGCMVTWVDPARRKAVEEALRHEGAEILPFRVSIEGLTIEEKTSIPL